MPAKKTHEQVIRDHTVALPNGCIEWVGSRDSDGYGKCSRRDPVFGRVSLPHRLTYLLSKGSIPDHLEIDHKCRNRACVNPDHLEAIPHADNVRRGVRIRANHHNSKKTHCKRGHLLAGDNLVIEVWNDITMRKCRACRSAKSIRTTAAAKVQCRCGELKSPASRQCRSCYLVAKMLHVHGIRIRET